MRDAKKAAALRVHLQDLLDRCGDCPKRTATGPPDAVHAGCPLYAEIRVAGKELAKLERRPKAVPGKRLELTVPEYMRYKQQGMADDEIAWTKQVTEQSIKYWRHQHGITVQARHVCKKPELTVEKYYALKAEKLSDAKIVKRLGTSAHRLTAWKKEHHIDYKIQRWKVPNREVIEALKAGHSLGWIQYHLNVGSQRAAKLAKENGIEIKGSG